VRKKCIYAHPWVRGSVGLKARSDPPNRWAHHTVLPTKTSSRCIQFTGISFSFFNAGSQVAITVLVNLWFRLIFVAVNFPFLFQCQFPGCYHCSCEFVVPFNFCRGDLIDGKLFAYTVVLRQLLRLVLVQ